MAIIVGTLSKDPDETTLFRMDWSARLGTKEIASSTWDVPEALTLVANGVVEGNNKTYITLSGGISGKSYVLTNTITINETNEVWQRSGRLDVRQY